MRRVKTKSGEYIHVLASTDSPLPGEVCMSEAEYAWLMQILRTMHDPEDKSTALQGVMENKRENAAYSVFDSFPVPSAEGGASGDKRLEMALRYSSEIIEMLRGRRGEGSAQGGVGEAAERKV